MAKKTNKKPNASDFVFRYKPKSDAFVAKYDGNGNYLWVAIARIKVVKEN